jgi:hypothetical protein
MSMWKKFIVVYKKPLHAPKSPRKESKNGSELVLKVGCNIKNQRPLWIPDLPRRSSCFRKPLSSR